MLADWVAAQFIRDKVRAGAGKTTAWPLSSLLFWIVRNDGAIANEKGAKFVAFVK